MNTRRHPFRGFRSQLILALCFISAIPLLILQVFSYYRTTETIRANTNELIQTNMISTLQSVSLTMDAYSSVLSQLSMDDALVAYVKKLNAGEEKALTTNQLLRQLRAACYAKEYIQGVTVILPDGSMVFYDKLTGSNIRNAWMEQDKVDPKALFDAYTRDNRQHLIPTRFAMDVSNEKVYLFHVVRRIIDYKNIDKQPGIVLLSIDERLLRETINGKRGVIGPSFLINDEDAVMSAPSADDLGRRLEDAPADCAQAVRAGLAQPTTNLITYPQSDEALGLRLICVVDASQTVGRIADQQRTMLILLFSTLLFLGLAIVWVTRRLSGSVREVASAMQQAGTGDMRVRVALDRRMPTEVATIAEQFNLMMEELDRWIRQVQCASEKQRNAEIGMLEAQINPHFLYNTLDSINWMAIDEEQMEISGAITALARILRYSVDGSNRMVPVKEEVEWLKQYLFLQQVRLKNSFSYALDVQDEALDTPIHKLLFQPFVENAIRHGFQGVAGERVLSIRIWRDNEALCVAIQDNGKGMDAAQMRAIQHAIEHREEQPGHIGILNAVSRMRMYYGEAIEISLRSAPEQGTEIALRIPLKGSEEVTL